MRRFWAGASGAEKLCALGAMTWRFCAAPQLHRLGGPYAATYALRSARPGNGGDAL